MLAHQLYSSSDVDKSRRETSLKETSFSKESRGNSAEVGKKRMSLWYTLVNGLVCLCCFFVLICCLAITSGIIRYVSEQAHKMQLGLIEALAHNQNWVTLIAWIGADMILILLFAASLYIPMAFKNKLMQSMG